MADDNEANGCGCLIVLVIIGFVCHKVYKVIDSNKETIASGWEVVKGVGPWVLLGIVGCVVFIRILSYLRRIKKWERTDFRQYLNQNGVENWLIEGESSGVSKTLDSIESSVAHAKRRLDDIKCMDESLRKGQ
jgi:hypothetical protein